MLLPDIGSTCKQKRCGSRSHWRACEGWQEFELVKEEQHPKLRDCMGKGEDLRLSREHQERVSRLVWLAWRSPWGREGEAEGQQATREPVLCQVMGRLRGLRPGCPPRWRRRWGMPGSRGIDRNVFPLPPLPLLTCHTFIWAHPAHLPTSNLT